MNRIYISERGDDKNDGRSRETPIYSWKQAVKLCDGNPEIRLMEGPTLQRLTEEIEKRRKMKWTSRIGGRQPKPTQLTDCRARQMLIASRGTMARSL